jgi:glycogen operon protein
VSTHDLPPLAGWWEGADVRERAALGQIQSDTAMIQERNAEREALVSRLVDEDCITKPDSGEPEVIAGAHAFIASTPSNLMLVQAEDLACMRTGVNLPGTDTERPNWRLRLPEPVETLLRQPAAQSILDPVRAAGRGTGHRPLVRPVAKS